MICFGEPSFNAPFRKDVRQQSIGCAVKLGERDDVVARLGDIDQGVLDRRHSGTHAEAIYSTFECGNSFLQNCIGRISDPGVDVPLNLQVEQRRPVLGTVKLKCHSLIDRYCDGFGRGIAVVSRVNRDGFSFHA